MKENRQVSNSMLYLIISRGGERGEKNGINTGRFTKYSKLDVWYGRPADNPNVLSG